jgi:putative ABC transport system permease protein
VLAQVLTEAVLLTSTGGLIGVGIGLGGALGSKQVLPKLVDDFPPPILTAPPVVVAFAISAVIGVVAGSYPAYRAARMRPIDALRFE